MNLTIDRAKDTLAMTSETADSETPQISPILALFSRKSRAPNRQLSLSGKYSSLFLLFLKIPHQNFGAFRICPKDTLCSFFLSLSFALLRDLRQIAQPTLPFRQKTPSALLCISYLYRAKRDFHFDTSGSSDTLPAPVFRGSVKNPVFSV
jgi:hypothetical protein